MTEDQPHSTENKTQPTPGNADATELRKFATLASRWWDPESELKPLHQINPLRLDYIEQRAGIEGRTCVDVGCGGGLLSEGLARRRAASVLGIDLSEDTLTVARLHAQEAGLDNIEYRLISAGELAEERPGQFERVTCMEVLEHVPDPGALIADLAALLRPAGDLFVSTLNRTPKAFALGIVGAEYLLRLVPRGTHEYERFIRPSELDEYARDCGLQLVDLIGIVYDPFQQNFRLGPDVDVNYIAHFRAPESRP